MLPCLHILNCMDGYAMNAKHEKDCRDALLKISTDSKRLDLLLSGRLKYEKTGTAHPFEGISVIHNISHQTAVSLGLLDKAQQLTTRLTQCGLDGKIAFVSQKSFHITTFDLINKSDHSSRPGVNYQSALDCIKRVSIQFLQNYNLSAVATITGVSMFPPNVLKLDITLETTDKSKFKGFRLGLYDYLNNQDQAQYQLIRPSWNGGHSHHITLGYVIDAMTDVEIDQFLRVLKEFNEKFTPVPFTLTQGEVTGFSDMDHYSSVNP